MRINELLNDIEYEVCQGDINKDINLLTSDSRKVKKGTAFVCIEGMKADGHKFAEDCANKGASLIVAARDLPCLSDYDCCVVKVKDTRYAFALMSCCWFGYPSKSLKVIGITGTKGKTTTAYMVKSILEHSGCKCGLMGTIEIFDGINHISAGNTTPESYTIQENMRRMLDNGCTHLVMEVSSQGLMLNRTAGIEFDTGVFTNIEPDHIGPGEHRDFEHYLSCKKLLFSQCEKGIINIDDPHFHRIMEGHTCTMETFGFAEGADFRAVSTSLYKENGRLGVEFFVKGIINDDIKVGTPGGFSVHNALAAMAVCSHFNININDIKEALLNIKVKGRIEMVEVSPFFTLMIDYAHNAMALENVLNTLREYEPSRLITLFGCGGNRSKLRRFEMGEVSGKLSDLTIITSDNPRDEDPLDIIEDIKTGINKTSGKYIEIPDRKEAIKWCIQNGKPGDIIVLAGKGHEDYQEIKGKKYPMDERVIISDILKETMI